MKNVQYVQSVCLSVTPLRLGSVRSCNYNFCFITRWTSTFSSAHVLLSLDNQTFVVCLVQQIYVRTPRASNRRTLMFVHSVEAGFRRDPNASRKFKPLIQSVRIERCWRFDSTEDLNNYLCVAFSSLSFSPGFHTGCLPKIIGLRFGSADSAVAAHT